MRAVLSIGSNLEDSGAHLDSVSQAFGSSVIASSGVYSTPPWGPVEQGDFLNQILIVEVDGTPEELLARCQEIENQANRTREVRWGPRTLDVDVVQVIVDKQEVTSDDPVLTLPHPRAHERAFVLVPWLDADPNAQLQGRPVAELLGGLDADEVDQIRLVHR